MKKKGSTDYHRRLVSLWEIHSDSEQQLNVQSQQVDTIKSWQTKSFQLKNTMTKIKSQNLVREFVKKMKKNLVSSEHKEFTQELKSGQNINSQENSFEGVSVNETSKAYFMAVDTLAILIIQLLSSFQGLFYEYRQIYLQTYWLFALKALILMVFWMKVILGLISFKIVRGVQVRSIRTLTYHYVTSSIFFFDFGILITTLLTLALPNSMVIGWLSFIMCIFSMPVFIKNIEIIQNRFMNNNKKRLYWDLLKIIMFDIFFAHLISTVLYTLSLIDEENNWRKLTGIDGEAWYVQYLMAYYWGTTIITTVGFGDILPSNYRQAIVIAFIMLFGCLVLSYNISEVGRIISNLRQMNLQRQNDLATFKRMVKDDQISNKLQESIINYIDQMSEMKNQMQFLQRKQLLAKLPQEMHQMYQLQSSSKTFSNLPFFKFMITETLIGFSEKINGKVFYPGSQLTHKKSGLINIMIIRQGQFAYTYFRKGSSLNGTVVESRKVEKNKNEPYLLNKYLLVPDRQISYRIEAKTYCFTYIIQKNDFYEVLRNQPNDNQFYFSLLHKNFIIETQWQRQSCKYCPDERHTLFDCTKMHYIPYHTLIISRHISLEGNPQPGNSKKKRYKSGIFKKNPLFLWHKLFKKYEKAWQIHNKKAITERMALNKELMMQKQEDDESQNWIQKFGLKVLNQHCCSLKEHQLCTGDEIQVDILNNFSFYFVQNNPSQLNLLNLRKQRKKKQEIKIRSGVIPMSQQKL